MPVLRFLRVKATIPIWLVTCIACALCDASIASDRIEHLKAMIGAHRQKADTLGSEGLARNAPFMGTAFNEIGEKEYTCAALAYLFGKDAIFERLGHIEELPLSDLVTDGDLQVLMIVATSHENWALAAEHVLAMSERNRIETWNLDCVRQHDIGKEHYVARTGPEAQFEVRDDQMHVLGDIEHGFHDRFRAFLVQHPDVKYIVLGSGGGSVRDAILAGLLIRNAGLDTTLKSDCYSACSLLFLGGVNRMVWSPYPRLGFHQASQEGKALPWDHEVYKLVRKYADAMGANGAFVLNQMYRAKPEDMSYPDVWDLCEPQIATWVQRGC